MIEEKEVEESVAYLFASASDAAQARANRSVLNEGLKRIQAIEFMKAEGAVEAKKMAGLASKGYRLAIKGLGAAIFADEQFRALRDAHSARIEAWRTQEATKRSVRL